MAALRGTLKEFQVGLEAYQIKNMICRRLKRNNMGDNGSNLNSNLSARVSVLEVQMENTEKGMEKLDNTVSEMYKATLEIKHHLAKQNRCHSTYS